MTNRIVMSELLKELRDTKLVKVTGSYADGTQNDNSDIDFYVKEDNPEYKRGDGPSNIQKIIAILGKHGVKWQSSVVGYISTHKTPGNGFLPTQLEFSDLFDHRPDRLPEVTIEGVTFKTH